MTLGSTVNMAAENGDHPPGMLQRPAELRHRLPRFEVDPVRPHHDLEWRMVRQDRDRLGGLGVDHVDQALDPLAAEIALVAA